MPDNPDVQSVIARAKAANVAQAKLRASMATVAAQAKQAPASSPAPGGAK